MLSLEIQVLSIAETQILREPESSWRLSGKRALGILRVLDAFVVSDTAVSATSVTYKIQLSIAPLPNIALPKCRRSLYRHNAVILDNTTLADAELHETHHGLANAAASSVTVGQRNPPTL